MLLVIVVLLNICYFSPNVEKLLPGTPATIVHLACRMQGLSHLAAASAVSRGEVDLALGNEKAALQVKGTDFIPLQNKRYELVMRREDKNGYITFN